MDAILTQAINATLLLRNGYRMIDAVFPQFRPVNLGARQILQAHVRGFRPYSDFSVWNMLGWASQLKTSYAFLKRNLVIRSWDCYEDRYVYSLLGVDGVDEALWEVCQITDRLEFVPEVVVQNIRKPGLFEIEEDRDNHDYILSTKKLIDLSGNKLYSIRAEVSRFPICHPDYAVRILDFGRAQDTHDVLKLAQLWCARKGLSDSGIVQGVAGFIEYADCFDTVSAGVYLGKQIVAFNMNELVNEDIAITHFAMSDLEYEGSSRFATCAAAKALYQRGYMYLNYEQDVGLPGLRQAKLSYRPVGFLKKYRVGLVGKS
jgi:uncharacterized protein